MPIYVVRWSNQNTTYEKVGTYEFDEFFVEDDVSQEGETRLSQLSRLAMQIEESRALLFNRPKRRFEGMGVKISTERVVPLTDTIVEEPEVAEPTSDTVEIVEIEEFFTKEEQVQNLVDSVTAPFDVLIVMALIVMFLFAWLVFR